MQTKDIPDGPILELLATRQGTWSTWCFYPGITNSVVEAFPLGTPEKLIRSKMASLIRRGLSGGCSCGCRGDYEITDKGLAAIGRPRTKQYTGY